MKIYYILLALSVNITYAQRPLGITHSGRSTGQRQFPIEHYQELENPKKTDINLWKSIKGTNFSWGSTNIRYKKEVPPINKATKEIKITAWKGERISTQFIVWGNKDINKLSFEVSDLIHNSNSYIISQNQILKGFVRYVMTDELNKDKRGGCGNRPNSSDFDSTLVADPIDHITKELQFKANNTQGCWLRIQVPTEALKGIYNGYITIKNGDEEIGKLFLKLNISERKLPDVKEWKFHLDLWQNPYAIARYHQTDPWSNEHMKALKPYMEMYRDAGGKSVTASIMHKPWNGQTYDYFESMVTWVKRIDGSWFFDYAIFDKWVQFMFDLGINKQINCYSMVPWKLSFQYFDQASNCLKSINAKPGDKEYEEIWTAMLKSFARHLKEKGWFDKTYISMDERPIDVMLTTLNIIRNADPKFKISLAGALHDELVNELDDYCVALRMKFSDDVIAERKAKGKITTYYTSCEEPYPNTFTFSNPADCEWFGWYAAKANLDGYLRWALNSWVIEPLLDSRFYTWAAGDTYLIYPGGRTSIRFEKMIDGIQAYEKIHILKNEFKKNRNTKAVNKINKILEFFDETELENTSSDKIIDKAKKELKSLGF